MTADEEPVVIYHSHTATEAYPSRTDISYASEPGAHYVLVSTREPGADEFRSFRIIDGAVTEEEVTVAAPDDRPAARIDPGGPAGSIARGSTAHPGYTWSKQMAIEVRIPTILRTYTGGAKSVEGTGGTLDELFSDLDARHGGLREPAGR